MDLTRQKTILASYACITRIRSTVGLGTVPLSRLPPAPDSIKFSILIRPVNRIEPMAEKILVGEFKVVAAKEASAISR